MVGPLRWKTDIAKESWTDVCLFTGVHCNSLQTVFNWGNYVSFQSRKWSAANSVYIQYPHFFMLELFYQMKSSGQIFSNHVLKLHRLCNVTTQEKVKMWPHNEDFPQGYHGGFQARFSVSQHKRLVLSASGPLHMLFLSLFPPVFKWLATFFFFSIQICASMSPPRKDTLPRRFPHSPLWFFTICNPDSPIIFITYYNDISTICLPVCSISHNELQDPPQGKGYMHNCFISQGKPSVSKSIQGLRDSL